MTAKIDALVAVLRDLQAETDINGLPTEGSITARLVLDILTGRAGSNKVKRAMGILNLGAAHIRTSQARPTNVWDVRNPLPDSFLGLPD